MAIKKSELYSSLWASCDELRGGMDASQYKDYVLAMLFIKYISDKYADMPFAPIQVPKGASFKDMVALTGRSDIGDKINKKIIAPLEKANRITIKADFNDPALLGSDKDMVERLGNLIAIFQNPALDFSKNRADGDDILGDAYEYLMRHFATQSGKSKGQFYTPAEVSRVIAKIIGIGDASTTNDTTVYDPTCGSGSLLLKVGDEAKADVTLYGQEKDEATSGLAYMNMVLHNKSGALIEHGNTLTQPKFKDNEALKTFDYVVANPPFSDKRWSTGLDALNDPYERFKTFGAPPAKQGDYAYLLHIVRSLNSTGKGACILPHGVLFRGNAEADIRRNLVRRGYIKGIVGLPANLFYGTGIPACIVVIDKEGAQARKGIFMVDASRGYLKDGPKNRLREQDIHKIVDVFTRQDEADPSYARMVGVDEIEKNDYNLNLPRYIDSTRSEDQQDIEGHLKGGIPVADVAALAPYWTVCPKLKATLFKPNRPGYLDLAVEKSVLKAAISGHAEFKAFVADIDFHFANWRAQSAHVLKTLVPGFHPKELIHVMSESLLYSFADKPLLDPYGIYQHLMDYWSETMQDDCYLIAEDGWKAETYRIIEKDKKDKEKKGGWACDLVPKSYLVVRYFAKEQAAIDQLGANLDAVASTLTELEEEHGDEDGAFSGFDKINAASVKDRIREIGKDKSAVDELAVLKQWGELAASEAALKKQIKEAEAALDAAAYAHYPKLTEAEIKTLVVEDKWFAALDAAIHGEMDRVNQSLTQRVKVLAERYETPLPRMVERVTELEAKVNRHLEKMGLTKKRQIKQGAMQELLSPKSGDEVRLLREVSSLKGRIGWQGLKQAEFTTSEDEPFLITGMNFKDGAIRWDQVYHISEARYEMAPEIQLVAGDVLMTKDGTIGKVLYIDTIPYPGKASLNSHLLLFRPIRGSYNPKYLYYQLGTRRFKDFIELSKSGTTFFGLSQAAVGAYPVLLPPIEEQIAIATVLSDMDAEIAALETKLAKARDLKQGMMQELLTGRIRLV